MNRYMLTAVFALVALGLIAVNATFGEPKSTKPFMRAKPTQARVEPKTQTYIEPRLGQPREIDLLPPPRKEHRYTTKRASGEEYAESEIERLSRIRDEAFDELDQELEKYEW